MKTNKAITPCLLPAGWLGWCCVVCILTESFFFCLAKKAQERTKGGKTEEECGIALLQAKLSYLLLISPFLLSSLFFSSTLRRRAAPFFFQNAYFFSPPKHTFCLALSLFRPHGATKTDFVATYWLQTSIKIIRTPIGSMIMNLH